jgi:hypothetical protein
MSRGSWTRPAGAIQRRHRPSGPSRGQAGLWVGAYELPDHLPARQIAQHGTRCVHDGGALATHGRMPPGGIARGGARSLHRSAQGGHGTA